MDLAAKLPEMEDAALAVLRDFILGLAAQHG